MALEDQVSSLDDFIIEQITVVNKSKKLASWKRRAKDKFFNKHSASEDTNEMEVIKFPKKKRSF